MANLQLPNDDKVDEYYNMKYMLKNHIENHKKREAMMRLFLILSYSLVAIAILLSLFQEDLIQILLK